MTNDTKRLKDLSDELKKLKEQVKELVADYEERKVEKMVAESNDDY
jgi:hypothetical protein